MAVSRSLATRLLLLLATAACSATNLQLQKLLNFANSDVVGGAPPGVEPLLSAFPAGLDPDSPIPHSVPATEDVGVVLLDVPQSRSPPVVHEADVRPSGGQAGGLRIPQGAIQIGGPTAPIPQPLPRPTLLLHSRQPPVFGPVPPAPPRVADKKPQANKIVDVIHQQQQQHVRPALLPVNTAHTAPVDDGRLASGSFAGDSSFHSLDDSSFASLDDSHVLGGREDGYAADLRTHREQLERHRQQILQVEALGRPAGHFTVAGLAEHARQIENLKQVQRAGQ